MQISYLSLHKPLSGAHRLFTTEWNISRQPWKEWELMAQYNNSPSQKYERIQVFYQWIWIWFELLFKECKKCAAGVGKGKKKAESQLQTALLPTPLPPVQVLDKQPIRNIKTRLLFRRNHQNIWTFSEHKACWQPQDDCLHQHQGRRWQLQIWVKKHFSSDMYNSICSLTVRMGADQ